MHTYLFIYLEMNEIISVHGHNEDYFLKRAPLTRKKCNLCLANEVSVYFSVHLSSNRTVILIAEQSLFILNFILISPWQNKPSLATLFTQSEWHGI